MFTGSILLLMNVGCCTLRSDFFFCCRFDARLYFTDKAQFIFKPSEAAPLLTPEEEEIEMRCDEERYLDLHRDSAEYELQQGKSKPTKLPCYLYLFWWELNSPISIY